MQDIALLAKRIILIGKGKILYDGSLAKLKSRYGSFKTIDVNTKQTIKNVKMKGVISRSKTDFGYSFVIDSNIISVSKFVSHITSKYSVDDIDIEGELIDDMIIKLYKYYEI
jgi:ABC-2 type transport system ATP-binding protein